MPGMKMADLENSNYSLRKKIAFVIKVNSPPSKYISIFNTSGDICIQLDIKENSILIPGSVQSNTQDGFR
jgi:hypothetical protein